MDELIGKMGKLTVNAPTFKPTIRLDLVIIDDITIRYQFKRGDKALSFMEAMRLFAERDNIFVKLFVKTIAECKFAGVLWECPPVTPGTMDTVPFEFVLIKNTDLSKLRKGDADTFGEYFTNAGKNMAVVFQGLGKNPSMLIAPVPLVQCMSGKSKYNCYVHFKKFLMGAPEEQVFDTLAVMGREVLNTKRKIWLNTHGLGVAWLHIRLDPLPKYYEYDEYMV